MSEDPSPEELDSLDNLAFSLQEYLQEKLDELESNLSEARADNVPAKIIAEKQEAIQAHEAVTEQANAYLCAMHDEINKGERSVLRVDTKLSNTAYTYITLSSFDDWAKQYGRTVLTELQKTTGTTLSAKQPQPDALAKPQPRMKMREQEDAILDAIKELGFDPTAFPPKAPGKRGVKSEVRDRLADLPLFENRSAFKNAWDRLRESNSIVDAPILL
jgi:small-conductance mechanosensitive channel